MSYIDNNITIIIYTDIIFPNYRPLILLEVKLNFKLCI